jgi:hypothetical protein
MSAGKHDIIIEQGATFTEVYALRDVNHALINLTAYTGAMQIRESAESTTTLASSTGTSPTITLTMGGTAGTITVSISATNTAALNFDQAVYDLEITTGTTVTRLLAGNVTLSKEVTR